MQVSHSSAGKEKNLKFLVHDGAFRIVCNNWPHILTCKYLNINIITVVSWMKWSRGCVHDIRILKKILNQNTSESQKALKKRMS